MAGCRERIGAANPYGSAGGAVTAVLPPPVWLSVKVDISRMPVVIVNAELVAT